MSLTHVCEPSPEIAKALHYPLRRYRGLEHAPAGARKFYKVLMEVELAKRYYAAFDLDEEGVIALSYDSKHPFVEFCKLTDMVGRALRYGPGGGSVTSRIRQHYAIMLSLSRSALIARESVRDWWRHAFNRSDAATIEASFVATHAIRRAMEVASLPRGDAAP